MNVGECRAVRINEGNFGVPWAHTKQLLEASPLDITVVSFTGQSDSTFQTQPTGGSSQSGGNGATSTNEAADEAPDKDTEEGISGERTGVVD